MSGSLKSQAEGLDMDDTYASSDESEYEGPVQKMSEEEIQELLNREKKQMKRQRSFLEDYDNKDDNTPSKATINSSSAKSREKAAPIRFVSDKFMKHTLPKVSAYLPPFYKDAWDTVHVKLPCSPQNIYELNGQKLSKWYLIQTALTQNFIHNSKELEDVLNVYYAESYDYSGLHHFFNSVLSEEEHTKFFTQTLPNMIELALQLPFLIPEPLPLLYTTPSNKLFLDQKQIACLLCNAFFCTMPSQGGDLYLEADTEESPQKKRKSRRIIMQDFNFDTLYIGGPHGICLPSVAGKLKCLLQYFETVTNRYIKDQTNPGKLSLHRVALPDKTPDWRKSTNKFTKVTVDSQHYIEDIPDHLQIDFANKMIGGGVLGKGCVQEEIRFVINPELLITLLLCSKMEDNECIMIKGCERFSCYSGYSHTFEYTGPYVDNTPKDDLNRINTTVAAVDALYFGMIEDFRKTQYRISNIERELNKSYLAFAYKEGQSPLPVATGNWGCGVFGGYHDLKAVLQLMAAAEAGVDVHYCTFGVAGLAPTLIELVAVLRSSKVTVGQIYEAIEELSKPFNQPPSEDNESSQGLEIQVKEIPQLFNYIIEKFESIK